MLNLKETEKIELWAVTGLIGLSLIFSAIQGIVMHNSPPFPPYSDNFWISILFSHVVIWVIYLLLIFYVKQEVDQSHKNSSIAVILVFLLINVCFILNVISAYFMLLLAIKIFVIYIQRKQKLINSLNTDATLLFACSLFLHAVIVLVNADNVLKAYFLFVVPIAILMYLNYMYAVLPNLWNRNRRGLRFIGTSILLALLSCLPVLLLIVTFLDKYFNGNPNETEIMAFNFITQLIFVSWFAWGVYKARINKSQDEITNLKTELGKSDANLNFLKSQINPHFLFNALNTLYGTALQENAERTGEGIQKLGDMMRFMLHENTEDKISLISEVDYLNNYIELQKLRTSKSADIRIDTHIENESKDLFITPMLLIPFVENAFKHGISLNQPSHIKITLQTKENTLYFDVYNSIHLKTEQDPEKLQSGIGLENVKQRLALVYYGKHELVIRENAKEFFVHLTLKLD